MKEPIYVPQTELKVEHIEEGATVSGHICPSLDEFGDLVVDFTLILKRNNEAGEIESTNEITLEIQKSEALIIKKYIEAIFGF